MEKVNVGQLAHWTKGTIVRGTAHTDIRSISTDTRTLKSGSFFVPLAGEHFDGHTFILDAIARGARGAFCSEDQLTAVLDLLAEHGIDPSFAVIRVADTLTALQDVARGYRAMFEMPVIGVTGSNGKTTTKEMIAAMLSTQVPVAWTQHNLNNQIGVPLTLFDMESHLGAIVVEMGTNAPGEIEVLASIACPTVGVVTNVGPVHLEGLGDVEEVAKEKSELIRALPDLGVAVINADDPRVKSMARATRARVVTFGFQPDAHVRAESVETRGLDGTRFVIHSGDLRFPVVVRLAGRHQISNALAAAAAVLAMGFPKEAVQEGLLALKPTPMRMQVRQLKHDIVLIDDAYNASPLSMEAAIETLADISTRRRVAILGGMLELGQESKALHERVGASVEAKEIEFLVAIGPEGRWIMEGALAAGMPSDRVQYYRDVDEAADQVPSVVQPGDVILLKASRGYRLERVGQRLEKYLETLARS